MTDKNSSSHHHHHHHHCCPKQLQRQQANQQTPSQTGTTAATTTQNSCKETTNTGKKNDQHQNVITSVSSKQSPSPSSHPHRIDLDNSTLSTTTAAEQPVTENPNGAHMKNGVSSTSSSSGQQNQQQQHVITNNRSTTTPSSIVAANQHLNSLLNTPTNLISVTVAPFTGGPFTLTVNKRDSVEELKKAVAKKLKVLKDRICLLYRESQLSEGSLDENSVVDGSRITLLPRAETGLLAQKPEQSVMQALESLNDSQVVDFLSGKAPLNLTMRLGDHMMLIQLQLSTVNASSGNKRSRTSSTASTKPSHSSSTSTASNSTNPPNLPPCCSNKPPVSSPNTQSTTSSSRSNVSSDPSSIKSKNPPLPTSANSSQSTANSNPLRMPNTCPSSNNIHSSNSAATSANTPATGRPGTSSCPAQGGFNGSTKSTYKPKLDTRALAEASKNLTQTLKQLSSEVLTTKSEEERPRKRARTNGSNLNGGNGESASNASRKSGSRSDNERQGSSSSSSSAGSSKGGKGAAGGGAIIESMHHHGKGVYSGTFSGTLNPALQDRNGQPKRDITTIIHILNDLLCAQYKNYTPGTPAENPATNAATSNANPGSTSTTNSSSKTRSSELPKAEQTTKLPNSGIKSCNCNNDLLQETTSSLPKSSKNDPHGSHPVLIENGGQAKKLYPHIHTIGSSISLSRVKEEETAVFQDQIKVTKGKMEQLKRIMEERKAKRRARREARAAPYSTSWSLKSSETMETEEQEENVDINGDSTVKMQLGTTSGNSSSNNSGTNSNGQNNPASQTGAGGNPSDIFNPELEPVTA